MIYIDYKPGFTLNSRGKQFNIKEVNVNEKDKTISGVLSNWDNGYKTNAFLIKKVNVNKKEKWEIELENNDLIVQHKNLEILIRHTLKDVGYDINF